MITKNKRYNLNNEYLSKRIKELKLSKTDFFHYFTGKEFKFTKNRFFDYYVFNLYNCKIKTIGESNLKKLSWLLRSKNEDLIIPEINDVVYISNFIIHRMKNDNINQLKLQMLLYYTEAYFQSIFNDSIIPNDFIKCTHCVAVEEIQSLFLKDFGIYGSLEKYPLISEKRINEEYFKNQEFKKTFILDILNVFGIYTGSQLESMIRQEDPFKREKTINGKLVISKDLMREFYK